MNAAQYVSSVNDVGFVHCAYSLRRWMEMAAREARIVFRWRLLFFGPFPLLPRKEFVFLACSDRACGIAWVCMPTCLVDRGRPSGFHNVES